MLDEGALDLWHTQIHYNRMHLALYMIVALHTMCTVCIYLHDACKVPVIRAA